jgi:hypothetical protein
MGLGKNGEMKKENQGERIITGREMNLEAMKARMILKKERMNL